LLQDIDFYRTLASTTRGMSTSPNHQKLQLTVG